MQRVSSSGTIFMHVLFKTKGNLTILYTPFFLGNCVYFGKEGEKGREGNSQKLRLPSPPLLFLFAGDGRC